MSNKPQNKEVNIKRAILEKLREVGKAYVDVFLPPQYSYARPTRRLFGLDKYPKVSQRTLLSTLSRLQRQGLVQRARIGQKSCWDITNKGSDYLKNTKSPKVIFQPLKKDGVTRLVIFDVPEKYRKKRDSLRVNLIASDFKQLQKSVWVGFNPLPKDFIELITELRLDKMVHIFDVKNKGTLV